MRKIPIIPFIPFLILMVMCGTLSAQEFDMKKELKRLAKLDTFPGNIGFYNSQGVELYKRWLKNPMPDSRRYDLLYELSWQWVSAGHPDSALCYMDTIPDAIWDRAYSTNRNFDKLFMAGICHLRIGEQRNCQENHNEYSCIMPLNEDAQHIYRSGSEKAIEYFTKAVERNPQLYKAIWLMNIAYMTLGKYPDEVPDKYLIDFDKYPQDKSIPYFKNIAAKLGVDMNSYYGGTITEDFNNDGFVDIFTTSGDLETNCRLYISNGKGGFRDETEKAGLIGITGGGNLTHADYNNDGFDDIYIIRGGWLGNVVGKYHPNSLLKNNGDGTFTDVTKKSGLLAYYPSHTASWADYDNDGWLDLFVGSENGKSALYHNDKGVFTDVSKETDVLTSAFVKASYWADYNKDGLMDLYVSVYEGDNLLYENQGKNESGQFRFIDKASVSGTTGPYLSFSTFFFDFNNDGYPDLFVPSYPINVNKLAEHYFRDTTDAEISALYINNKDGTFTNIAEEANLDRIIEVMGMNFGDIDNDGFLDIYIGTGYPAFEALMPNLMLRNDNGKQLLEVANAGFGHLQKGHGIGFGDFDNDGDQDLYISQGGFMEADNFWNSLLENPGNDNNWITLDLEGKTSNRSAIGAEITIEAAKGKEDRKIFRVVGPGGSFGSSTLQQEIGLGDCDQIRSINVYWPASDTRQTFKDVTVNKMYKIIEGKNKLKEVERKEFNFKSGESDGHHHHH